MSQIFRTASELSDYQAEREVLEALRVQAMTGDERYRWLEENWGRLQQQADLLYAGIDKGLPTVRHFRTLEEKNAFDRAREIEWSMQVATRPCASTDKSEQ
ncbi:hypothetical protein [Noviherbaspirillum sp.]|uniref:hypothetical protein n=1 Tax=Noviherbaspirillum sp. TaxID=1926288 RepID=UPI002FE14D0B